MQQAKVVVLGEPRTGKSSLITSLTGGEAPTQIFDEDTREAFVTVEIPGHELEHNDSGDTVCLRFWECSEQKEQDVAFPGALFCIIVFDIRAPETANAAFNKWLAIKESHMTESFLFVVGTFLDMSVHRRVEVSDVCKACAMKDAVYVEVSNTTGSNLSLLRNLLIQRVNYMLKVRQDLKHGIQFDISSGAENAAAAKDKKSNSLSANANGSQKAKQLKTPFLEEDVDAGCIGSILASAVGIEYWPGYEAERTNLTQIGKSLTNLVNSLEACDVSGADIDAVSMEGVNTICIL
jgi:GTPase SAR1 family protein